MSDVIWSRAALFDTGRPDYLGWVSIFKRRANQRMLELFGDDPTHRGVAKREKLAIMFPFLVYLIELDREAHESERYETELDYRRREHHLFATEEKAREFLRGFGFELEDLKPVHQVDFP